MLIKTSACVSALRARLLSRFDSALPVPAEPRGRHSASPLAFPRRSSSPAGCSCLGGLVGGDRPVLAGHSPPGARRPPGQAPGPQRATGHRRHPCPRRDSPSSACLLSPGTEVIFALFPAPSASPGAPPPPLQRGRRAH